MNKVTQDDIIKMNELYLKLHTYAAVAREVGFAASTVKKYIIPDYVSQEDIEIKKFDKPLPDFSTELFLKETWNDMLTLSQEEKDEIKELWKELVL